jgi:uncharacterized protein YggE
MNMRYLVGTVGVLILVGAALACGGDGDGGGKLSGVRTQKGLSVAALTEGLTASQTNTSARGAAVPAEKQSGGALGQPATGYDASSAGGIAGPNDRMPLLQQSNDGITVQGFGSASADADSAIVEFYFSRNGPTDTGSRQIEPGVGGSGGIAEPSAPNTQEVAPITEGDLQPVIDAIVSAGVAREDVEFIGQSYFDKFSSSATLRAKVGNVGAVDGVVKAANDAGAGLAGLVLNSANVSYTVKDCTALEEAAMRVAVEDAKERSAVFARSLGVGVGAVTGASNYSYFGGTPCDPGVYPGPYPLAGIAYAQGQPRQVQVIANISVTYAIQ